MCLAANTLNFFPKFFLEKSLLRKQLSESNKKLFSQKNSHECGSHPPPNPQTLSSLSTKPMAAATPSFSGKKLGHHPLVRREGRDDVDDLARRRGRRVGTTSTTGGDESGRRQRSEGRDDRRRRVGTTSTT
ncbi:hypothetical protein M6B38_321785 [Iris pallida]|uniref:Uncharacterized protein n=1 Tax=Iris pallida TaxID=29817 RepID=A0AAX6HA81_IRIPA|nr:hypothetical protein M6B38_321785 [Iris pallida]